MEELQKLRPTRRGNQTARGGMVDRGKRAGGTRRLSPEEKGGESEKNGENGEQPSQHVEAQLEREAARYLDLSFQREPLHLLPALKRRPYRGTGSVCLVLMSVSRSANGLRNKRHEPEEDGESASSSFRFTSRVGNLKEGTE
jgi:hypothetical protein